MAGVVTVIREGGKVLVKDWDWKGVSRKPLKGHFDYVKRPSA